MTLNAIIPICMGLELVMVCIKSSSSRWHTPDNNTFIKFVDGVFMVLIPIYLFASVMWMLYFRSHYTFISRTRIMRMYQAGVLSVVGSAMLWTAFDVGAFNKDCNHDTNDSLCDGYELRTSAGIIAIVDACLYCIRPTKKENPGSAGVSSHFSEPNNNDRVYIIQNELPAPAYEAPPNYFDLQMDQSNIAAGSNAANCANSNSAVGQNRI